MLWAAELRHPDPYNTNMYVSMDGCLVTCIKQKL
jgi:hypothetical protein